MRASEFFFEADPRIIVKKRRIIPGQTQELPPVTPTPVKVPKTVTIKPDTPSTSNIPDKQRLRMLNDLMNEYDRQFQLMKSETLPKLISRAKEVARRWQRPIPSELLQPVDHEFYFDNKKSMMDYYDSTMKDYRRKIQGLQDFIKHPAQYKSVY